MQITGTAGNDTLTGTSSDDIVDELGGNDLINASQGADQVNGGLGTDTLAVNMFNSSLFAAATGSRTYTIGASTITDSSGTLNTSFTSIQRITMTLAFNGDFGDTIDASAMAVGTTLSLTLAKGNDTVIGSGNSDTIFGSQGADQINGGLGTDTLTFNTFNTSLFAAATESRVYTLTATSLTDSSGTLNTSFSNVERITLSTIGNGSFGDLIDASAFTSTVTFGAALTITLGGGDDTVIGSAMGDHIAAGLGLNVIDAGDGDDTVVIDVDPANAATLFVTGSDGNLTTTHSGIQTNSVANAESFRIGTTGVGTTLTVDASGYVPSGPGYFLLQGHNGTDIFIGSTGNDIFGNSPGQVLGNDVFTGNGGADIFDYIVASDSINNDTITDLDADDVIDFQFNDPSIGLSPLCYLFIGSQAFHNIAGEYRYRVSGTQTLVEVDSNGDGIADQTLTIANGTFLLAETAAGSNILRIAGLSGTEGVDTITGTLGNDTIVALGGNDFINATQGSDQVDGGAGTDTLNANMSNSARFAASTGSRTYTITATHIGDSSGTINTSFTGVERIIVNTINTGDFGDTIDASGFVSSFGFPALRLFLGDGNDIVTGSAEDDFISVGLGTNTVNAGAGYDEVEVGFDGSGGNSLNVTVSGGQVLTAINGVVTNTIANAETVILGDFNFDAAMTRVDASGATGYSGKLVFWDNNGTNISIGSSGADIFANVHGGEAGQDIYTGNGGADIYDYTFAIGAMNGDTITDFDADDVIDLQFNTATANSGGLLATNFIGSAAFSGVAGQYRYQFVGGQTLLQVDTSGDGVADEILYITNGNFTLAETVVGSNLLKLGARVTTGTAAAETLTGTLGKDIVIALDGNDQINVTQGADQIDGGGGSDLVNAVMSNTTRFAAATGPRTYTITATTMTDSSGTLNTSFTNVERVRLSTIGTGDFGDTINASAWTPSGGVGTLALRLGNGSDTVIGSAKDDDISTGLGVNTIDAGQGFDIVNLENDNNSGATIFVTMAGGAVVTTLNGLQTNSVVNAEIVRVVGINLTAAVTRVDASGLTGFAGTLVIWDNNGSNISIGSTRGDIFANLHGAETGNDVYTGNGGADIYDYTFAVSAMNNDTITDFDADDVIDLSFNTATSNAGGFLANQFIGSAAFTGVAGQYRYQISGNQTLVQVDTSGDGVADETLTITNGAFILAETAAGSNILKLLASADARNDFNGDGRSDILWRNDNGALAEWLSQANGSFVGNAAVANQVGTDWQIAGTGDYNGDGRDDILWRNNQGTLAEWLGQANGGFVGNANVANQIGNDWQIASTGDFNGDGRDDILWRNTGGTLAEWLGQANGGFVGNANVANQIGNDWQIASTGDFNGDGRADILWRHSSGTLAEWLAQANGGFVGNAAVANQVGTDWHVLGTADFNGDGRDDILWRHNSGTLAEWLGQANGGFSGNAAVANQIGTDWHVADLGDYNGDGRDDIVWRNDNGAVAQWLGQANGGFVGNGAANYQVDSSWKIQSPDILLL